MKRHTITLLIILLAGSLAVTTCNKEYFDLDKLSDEMELRMRMVAPVVYGNLSMKDILQLFDTVEYIDTSPTGLILFSYFDTVLSLSADTAIELPELDAIEFYLDTDNDIPVTIPVPPGDTFNLPRRTKSVDFVLSGENRLDSILLQGGNARLHLTSSFRHSGMLMISSQEIRDRRGNPFSETIVISDASGSFVHSVDVDMDLYTIAPIYRNDSNIVYLDFDLSLINSGNTIDPGDSCVVSATFSELGFYNVVGFLDPEDLASTSGSIEVPIWSDYPELASLEFSDPRFVFTMATSVGIPFAIDFDSVIATGVDGSQVELTKYDGNTLEFKAPGMRQMGETVVTDIQIDKTTSNIQEFLAVSPSEISYKIEGRTSTVDGDNTHFILDTSRVNLSLEFLLPLNFRSTGFALSDTMEFEIAEDGIDTTMIDSVEIVLTTINRLPIELAVQIYMLDNDHQQIDQVFDDHAPPILGASVVDIDGVTTEATPETTRIKFPASKIGKIEQTAYLRVEATLNTPEKPVVDEEEPFVKILSSYDLKYKIAVKALLKINTREL